MKKIAILGSTGSIGRQALEIVRKFKDRLRVVALAGGNNTELLIEQIKEFSPASVSVATKDGFSVVRDIFPDLEIYYGMEGLKRIATYPEAEQVLIAVSGNLGLKPTLSSLESGKNVALANKEALVLGGKLVMELARKYNRLILPVDSEHSAIFQCLQGFPDSEISRIILTASGGPFRNFTQKQLEEVTPSEALLHPTWKMGEKVTLDSATLMNKGLEIIEAYWLFGVTGDKISVYIHPQSIVHSMVEFTDGALFAQASFPDMRLPIQYAFSFPSRWSSSWTEKLGVKELSALSFEEPDFNKFPSLLLAYEALKSGGTAPAVLSTANEIAGFAFLHRKIRFTHIPLIVEKVLAKHNTFEYTSLSELEEVIEWTEKETIELISKFKRVL